MDQTPDAYLKEWECYKDEEEEILKRVLMYVGD